MNSKKKYKHQGFMILELVIYMAIFLVFVGGIFYGSKAIRAQQFNDIKMQANVIDRGLEAYAASHIGIDESSIQFDADHNIKYNHVRLYPKKLEDMKEIGILPKQMKLDTYKYTVSDDRTKYKLEAVFDNETYTSPRSNYK